MKHWTKKCTAELIGAKVVVGGAAGLAIKRARDKKKALPVGAQPPIGGARAPIAPSGAMGQVADVPGIGLGQQSDALPVEARMGGWQENAAFAVPGGAAADPATKQRGRAAAALMDQRPGAENGKAVGLTAEEEIAWREVTKPLQMVEGRVSALLGHVLPPHSLPV